MHFRMSTMANREKFSAVFQALVTELQEDMAHRGLPDMYNDRFRQCLCENAQGGKLNRGLTVVDTGQSLLQRPLSDEEFHQLSTLGWITEIFQASYLIWDDLMDNSEYRRGKSCWYRQEDIGLTAINDAAMLKSSIFSILKRHFRSHPEYCAFMELLEEAAFRTELGQLCDTQICTTSVEDMTGELYAFIAINKTAFYSFYLPVALALHYFQLSCDGNLSQARNILLPMGEYFQIQDDYLDVFGDPQVTGKVGTDIQDKKCSWVLVQALKHCNPNQRQVMLSSYGQQSSNHVASVRQVFQDLDMETTYQQFEETKIKELESEIERVDEKMGLRKDVFSMVLSKIARRNK